MKQEENGSWPGNDLHSHEGALEHDSPWLMLQWWELRRMRPSLSGQP